VIRPGDDDLAIGSRIVLARVLAGREHPGEQGGEEDAPDEEDEWMRESEGGSAHLLANDWRVSD